MKNPIYTIEKLKYNILDNVVIDIKQLDIHRGSCYVFYGDVGSGKTTLLSLLSKSISSKEGKILYESNDLNKISKSDYFKEMLFLPQDCKSPWFKIQVKDYLYKKVKSYKHLDNPKKRIKDIIRLMRLSNYLDRDYRNLSDGEKIWIDLSVSIACDTKVLIIDGFGHSLGEEKLNILSRVLYRKINFDGVTLIAGTHSKEKLAKIASVYIKLDYGRIVSVRSHKKKPHTGFKKNNKYNQKK